MSWVDLTLLRRGQPSPAQSFAAAFHVLIITQTCGSDSCCQDQWNSSWHTHRLSFRWFLERVHTGDGLDGNFGHWQRNIRLPDNHAILPSCTIKTSHFNTRPHSTIVPSFRTRNSLRRGRVAASTAARILSSFDWLDSCWLIVELRIVVKRGEMVSEIFQ